MFRFRAVLLFLAATVLALSTLHAQQFCDLSNPVTPPVDPPNPGGADYTVACQKAPADVINSRCTFVPLFDASVLPQLRQYSWTLEDPRNDSLPPIFYTPTPYTWTFQSPITYHTKMTYWLLDGEIRVVQHNVTIDSVPDEPYFAYTTSFGLCVTFDTPTGTPSAYRYHWIVGDTEYPYRDSNTISRVFDKPGIYTVSLETYRIDGTEAPRTYTLSVPVANMSPIATFVATRDANNSGLFTFDASASRDEPAPTPPRTQNCVGSFTNAAIARYDWDFGDGMVGSGMTTTHKFGGGNYNVTLRVTDRLGVTSAWTWYNISVPNQPPVASYDFDCTAGLTCSFNASASYDDHGITSYVWTFPGGSVTTTTPAVSHTFAATGTYSVSLTVSDGSLNSTATKTLRPTSEVPAGLYYYALQPCRLYDSRTVNLPLQPGEVRTIAAAPSINCGIPANAAAVAATFTLNAPQGDGFLALTPAGSSVQSYLHVTHARGSRSNDASIKLTTGSLQARSALSAPTDLIVDVYGYYAPAGAGSSTADGPLAFTPVTQCRMADSRIDGRFVINGTTPTYVRLRDNTNCPIPADADALAVNVTIPAATGTVEGAVSFGPSGNAPEAWTMYAHTAMLPTRNGTLMTLARTPGNDTALRYFGSGTSTLHTLIDLSGYFRPSSVAGGLRYFPLTPCRVFDGAGLQPSVPLNITIQGNCGVPRGAQAVMANVTAANFTSGSTVWATPGGQAFTTGIITYQPGEFAMADGVVLALSDQPKDLQIKSDGNPVVIIDVLGYFAQ